MATITSAQSGNFNSTSTWSGGVVPVDADAFVIAQGHLVTVNDDRRVTNGYDNSTIEGCLKIVSSGQLRMNGNLTINPASNADQHFSDGGSTSGAKLEMTNGAILEMRGTNSDAHYIRMEQERYGWIECDGDNPNSKTTLSSSSSEGAMYVSLTSATGFAEGDWVSMFVELENIDDYEIQGSIRTEGAIVHDISSNNVYLRQYVSPTTTISAVRGNVIEVADAAVFRDGYKIVFGTGSNLNARTITRINFNKNRIILDSNVTGSVVGETVYQSGLEKSHTSGDTFQKVATVLTSDAAASQADIVVSSTAGMSVGDKLWIEVNNFDVDTDWDYESIYTISSISGNTITLTGNLANARTTGAFVAIWSRDTQIRSTSPGDSNQRPFIYLLQHASTDGYYRRIRFRNILFDGIGSNSSNWTWYRGIMIGRCSYENNSYGQYASGFEGNCWTPNNRGNNACVFHRDWYQPILRNNIFYNGTHNYWKYSSGNHTQFQNNISSRGNYTNCYIDGDYGSYSENAYNLYSRSDDYSILFYHGEAGSAKFRQNRITHSRYRPLYVFYQMTREFDKLYIKGFRYEPYVGRGQDFYFLNSYIESVYYGYSINSNYYWSTPRESMNSVKATSINHNFRRNDVKQYAGYVTRTWDHDENEWFVRRDGWSDNDAGWAEHIYVPAGATVHIACEIKTNNFSAPSSGAYPYLEAYKILDRLHGGYENNTISSSYESSSNSYIKETPVRGFRQAVQYTSSSESDYERKTLTIEPQNHDYFLGYAVVSLNNEEGNATDEGWYQRRYEIYMDDKPFLTNINHGFVFNTLVGRGTSAVRTRKTRIGGRLR